MNKLLFLFVFTFYILLIKYLIWEPKITAFFLTIAFISVTFKLLWNKSEQKQSVLKLVIVFLILIIFLIFSIKSKPDSNKLNIFFVETNYSREFLSTKQMCAIESAAFNNPDSNVYIYSFKAKISEKLVKIYKNLKYIHSTPEEIFENTPLFSWWRKNSSIVQNGPYFTFHMTDSIRIAFLYKYGGFYSDLDTIMLRNLNPIQNLNGLGILIEFDELSIGSGVLIFKEKHPLLKIAITEMINNYDPNKWGANGPLLFWRSIQSYCKVDDIFANKKKKQVIFKVSNSSECDVSIFPYNYFYPVNWENYEILFEKNAKLDLKLFKNTYSTHFYGKFSDKIQVEKGDNSIYEYFAFKNCPYSYSLFRNKT